MEVQGNNRRRLASLRFEFLPRKSYKDRFCVTQERILKYFENRFIHKVRIVIPIHLQAIVSVNFINMFLRHPGYDVA